MTASRISSDYALPVAPGATANSRSKRLPTRTFNRSVVALNATNFFVAEVIGLVLPFLTDFLRDRGWRYDQIGTAAAMASLGVFITQTPAGILIDRLGRHRLLLFFASLALGTAYGVVPLVPTTAAWINPLVFLAGMVQSFLGPLLAALALGLGGKLHLNRVMGANQAWNHVGNVATALVAMTLVQHFGLPSVFYTTFIMSVLASAAVCGVARPIGRPARKHSASEGAAALRDMWQDRRIPVLVGCTGMFHLTNAAAMPVMALYTRHLGGSHAQVAALVVISQAVMVPLAYLAGRWGDRWGRKPTLALAFGMLPLRCAMAALCTDPQALLALQVMDGISSGIYGVLIATVCADLVGTSGRFNTLMGMATTALALGAVVGPWASGLLVEHLGFAVTFKVIATVGALASLMFMVKMPETKPPEPALPPGSVAARCL